MINKSYTKIVGERPENYSIISIMDITCTDFSRSPLSEKDAFTLNVIKNEYNGITTITQRITYDDLKELSLIIWDATYNYERRQREKKEEAGREAEAQRSGAD